MKNIYNQLFFLTCIFLFAYSQIKSQTVQTFSYTGSVQTFTIPPCVASISVDISGAEGALAPTYLSPGGLGGRVTAIYSVTSGQVLNIYVGGQNYNGGGVGSTYSGVGGGASDIRINGTALSNRVFVAGGGGGGGTNCYNNTNPGGAGGGTLGVTGQQCSSQTSYVGTGGAQTSGGTSLGGLGTSGTLGFGGNGGNNYGGGGGGGYYGGGGGSYGGGGGGSSYANASAINVVHTQGYRSGNGIVIISYVSGTYVNIATTSTAICSGASATLSVPGMTTYNWSTSSTASSIVVAPTSNTTYSVSGVTNTGCPVLPSFLTLSVNAGIPALTVNSSTNQICLGKSVTLTANGALTYSWNNNVTNGIAFTPTVTNVYSVIGANGCGTSTAAITISVAPLAVTVISNPTVVCAGNTSTLNVSAAANSYSWFPIIASGSSLVVSPNVNTIYTVAASDGTCSGIGTVAVNSLPIPTIVVSPTYTNVCSGVPVNLIASGGLNYTWTPGNLSGSSVTVTPNVPTGYNVIGSNSLGCTSGAAAAVVINSSPTLNIFANNNLICLGDQVNLTATGANSYTWNTGANSFSISVNPTSTTIYTLSGTTNSCSSSQTIGISVFSPTLAVSGSSAICVGKNATLTASSANTYAWSNGFTTAAIIVNPITTSVYSVSALTSSSGINCPSTATFQLLVKPNPTITAVSSKTFMCKNESLLITASGASSYSWSTGATSPSIMATSSLVTTVIYSVTGTSTNGCISTATTQLKINSCTGLDINKYDSSSLNVFPNPTNGEFKVSYDTEIYLNLNNELGQLIKVLHLNQNNNYQLTINDLNPGFYIISNQNQDQKFEKKILVIK